MEALPGIPGGAFLYIAPATKYLNVVIPAKAGIQAGTGCRIKSGMTELACLIAGLITDRLSIPEVFITRRIMKQSCSRHFLFFHTPWEKGNIRS